jgi:antitoxin MazE
MQSMAETLSRQSLRRWGNSLGIRLPAAVARAAHLQENQDVELTVVKDGVLIRPCQPHLSLEQRLALYEPMAEEQVEMMAWEPLGAEQIE